MNSTWCDKKISASNQTFVIQHLCEQRVVLKVLVNHCSMKDVRCPYILTILLLNYYFFFKYILLFMQRASPMTTTINFELTQHCYRNLGVVMQDSVLWTVSVACMSFPYSFRYGPVKCTENKINSPKATHALTHLLFI